MQLTHCCNRLWSRISDTTEHTANGLFSIFTIFRLQLHYSCTEICNFTLSSLTVKEQCVLFAKKILIFLKLIVRLNVKEYEEGKERKLYQDQALFSWFHCASNLRWKKCHCCSISCIFPIELSSLSRLRNWSLECDAILSHKSSAFLRLYFNLIKIHFRVTEFSRVSAVFQLFMMQISTNSKFSMITFQIWVQSKDEENNELKMRLHDT